MQPEVKIQKRYEYFQFISATWGDQKKCRRRIDFSVVRSLPDDHLGDGSTHIYHLSNARLDRNHGSIRAVNTARQTYHDLFPDIILEFVGA
jgi:hypothetical protein